MIDIEIKNIYDNVNVSRKIELLSNIINDQIIVENNGNKQIDYLFHSDQKLISKLDYEKVESFKEYPHLENIKKVIHQDYITLKWKLDNEIIYSKIELKNKQLFICESPSNPDINKRTTLIIRYCNNSNIQFNIKWQVI